MSHEVIIETRNLTKVYRDFWGRPKVQALKALDLQVYRGEIFGLLGPNGSGKTTTIKLLLGLLFPTEGEALIFNEPTTNVAKNERIGYLPEESYLYKFLNAEETLQFYGRLFKISGGERNKRVGRLIDMVGLTAAKHRQLREYSKGMQRRIGLAQALINNPELILLDEPTSGLDPIGTSEIKNLIRELREQGKTIVLSGHLLADMQDICDRIAILHRGELKEIGRVSDLLTVQDVTQIKARNLPAAAIEEIRDVIQRHGGEDIVVDHPTTTLEELFLRIVHESELHPGRRKVARDGAGVRPASPVEGELAGQAKRRAMASDEKGIGTRDSSDEADGHLEDSSQSPFRQRPLRSRPSVREGHPSMASSHPGRRVAVAGRAGRPIHALRFTR